MAFYEQCCNLTIQGVVIVTNHFYHNTSTPPHNICQQTLKSLDIDEKIVHLKLGLPIVQAWVVRILVRPGYRPGKIILSQIYNIDVNIYSYNQGKQVNGNIPKVIITK